MPTYEYRCSAGHQFEQVQRMSEAPLEACPQCGAPAERLLSAGVGLLFKGSGFYITDYRSDSYRKAAEADSGGASSDKASGGEVAGKPAGGSASSKDGSASSKDGGASSKDGGASSKDGGASSKDGGASPPASSPPKQD
jgi:putative FmdB family regulatory protein